MIAGTIIPGAKQLMIMKGPDHRDIMPFCNNCQNRRKLGMDIIKMQNIRLERFQKSCKLFPYLRRSERTDHKFKKIIKILPVDINLCWKITGIH